MSALEDRKYSLGSMKVNQGKGEEAGGAVKFRRGAQAGKYIELRGDIHAIRHCCHMDSSVQQLSDRIDAVSVANIQIRSGIRLRDPGWNTHV